MREHVRYGIAHFRWRTLPVKYEESRFDVEADHAAKPIRGGNNRWRKFAELSPLRDWEHGSFRLRISTFVVQVECPAEIPALCPVRREGHVRIRVSVVVRVQEHGQHPYSPRGSGMPCNPATKPLCEKAKVIGTRYTSTETQIALGAGISEPCGVRITGMVQSDTFPTPICYRQPSCSAAPSASPTD